MKQPRNSVDSSIQDLIQRLRSSPRNSASPSWSSDRQFEVIGTGRLPLQSHRTVQGAQPPPLAPPPATPPAPVTRGRLPGQFSRSRVRDTSRDTDTRGGTYFRAPVARRRDEDAYGLRYQQQQDPEMVSSWSRGGRYKRSPAPYKNIKIPLGSFLYGEDNPFYFRNRAPRPRRRVRVKQVVSAPAPAAERLDLGQYRATSDLGTYWDGVNLNDDHLQQLSELSDSLNREAGTFYEEDTHQVDIYIDNRYYLHTSRLVMQKYYIISIRTVIILHTSIPANKCCKLKQCQ